MYVERKLPSSSALGSSIELGQITSEDASNTQIINDIGSLRQGIIKTSKNGAKPPYTILLIGETGAGKSSVLKLIANVLLGNDIDHYNFTILEHSNQQDDSHIPSQANKVHLYELTSNNGTVVRILNTPGLADTCGGQQDELHKKSLVAQIKKHADSINAVLVVANGTVPRVTVVPDYVLSALSAVFPQSPANKIAFVLTNVESPIHQNFSGATLPAILQAAPQFLLNNPLALQRKYLKLKDDPKMQNKRAEMRRAVRDGEREALETLVDFFDWLDGRGLQPTTGMAALYRKSRNTVAKVTDPLVQQMKGLLRQAKVKVSGKSSGLSSVSRGKH